jgi:ferric-dicitrate binding protein FerR (iron transport regulator)
MAPTETVEPDLPRRLRRMIDLRGLACISRELAVSRESLARYLARLDVHAGTLERIERKLAALGLDAEASKVQREINALAAAGRRRVARRAKGGRRGALPG